MKSIKGLVFHYATRVADQVAALKKWSVDHKFISAAILLVVLGGGWWVYGQATKASAETRYVLGVAQIGTVISSVSASGQVSSSNQLDIQAKVSGEILSVNVTPGQKV